MHLLIATDGSEIATHAAAGAGRLVGEPAAVTVLAVLSEVPGDDASGFAGPTETPEEAQQQLDAEASEANIAIDAVVDALPEAWRAKVTRRTEPGDAGAMIVWVAEDVNADLVVVGSHGRSALKRLVIGSVSEHVVRHAPCPVLVVRAGAEHLSD